MDLWEEYVASVGGAAGSPSPTRTLSFGEEGRRVLLGDKRATSWLAAEPVAVPEAGEHALLVDAAGHAVAVLRTTAVRRGPLASVDDDFAYDEAQGDRTLLGWMQSHVAGARQRCAELGVVFTPAVEVVFERFEVVWPAAYAD